MARRTGRAAAAFVLFLGAAAYTVLVELHRPSIPANDVYGFFVPNMLHAVHAVGHGGRGLLWNPFQACGEPFFANSVTGLLYPPHLLFLVLDANAAVHAILIINMVVGAIGMLLLTRELGLSWVAALGGALAFEIGDPMVQLTSWSPMHDGPWTWLPWALLFCERLLRAPSRGGIAGLAAVLTLEILPGFVLITALTYQLIALRVGWEILARRRRVPWRAVGAVAAGLAIAPLLAAVQLLPAVELARASTRSVVSVTDLLTDNTIAWSDLVARTTRRLAPVPFLVAPLLLASVAPLASGTRRLATFYLVTGLLYAVLALGQTTPLIDLYIKLPPGAATLRSASRLFWVSGFCLAVLTALGLEVLVDGGTQPSRRRWRVPIVAVALAAGLYVLAPGGLRWTEAAVLAAVVAAFGVATYRPRLSRPAAWVVLGAVAINLMSVPLRYWGMLLPSADAYRAYAGAFAAIRPPPTEQDRVFLLPDIGAAMKTTLMQKTSTVLRIPGLFDFDALLTRRFAEYFAMLRQGTPLSNIEEVYFPIPYLTSGVRRRLLDVASVRYLIASSPVDTVEHALGIPRDPLDAPDFHVYRNNSALPRARYVPRVELVRDPRALLERLASGNDDLATIAFVEESPPLGFTGVSDVPRVDAAHFVTDDPEHVVIDVDAPERGFLVLADQYYPDWRGTVNGKAVPVLRANYLFRLVEVPRGLSRVELHYRPTSLAIGAVISAITLATLAVVLMRGRLAMRSWGRVDGND